MLRVLLASFAVALVSFGPLACGSGPSAGWSSLVHYDGLPRWTPFGRRDPYPLDRVTRAFEPGLDCDRTALDTYRGEVVRYQRAVRVHPAFRERLRRFEEVVRDVAVEIYRRPPRRIRHLGAFSCRPVRGSSTRLSEHALGNGIDVAAFEFGPAPRSRRAALPRPLRRRFTVRVRDHWDGADGAAAVHATFLRRLVERLAERDDVFRGHIGPGDGRHEDHFHFDAGPWRYVRIARF